MQEYLAEIKAAYRSGKATEHSYRGALQQLIQSIVPQATVINEPMRVECGAPDYVVLSKDNNIPLGFIEAKDIGDADLVGKGKNKEQFDRYKQALDNLIFTDYLTFRLYRRGVEYAAVSIGELRNNAITALSQNFSTLEDLIRDFCNRVSQSITSAETLAKMMAGKARLLADILNTALIDDKNSQNTSTLSEQLAAFKQILISNIDEASFADLYSQTIVYGMLAARLNDPTLDSFSRREAAELIPRANPFLRKLFDYIAGPDIDQRIEWIVDDLTSIFLACDVKSILHGYKAADSGDDPVIYFYETFLAEYNPKLREARGVYYTPRAVVRFIVQAVDELLQGTFGLREGLADTSKTEEVHRVQILDPAAGTGTFLGEIITQIHTRFASQQGLWSDYVDRDLLPRLHGFELLMASYAMAHLHLEELLRNTGFDPQMGARIGVYLTNSLEEHHPDVAIPFGEWLSTEANEANRIKREVPVMVVIGNPPYSGESVNKGKWITSLMNEYKKEPSGGKLQEKNSKWINDDYVKFIRFGQHYIDRTGEGILAYINNHGFLDNPTFRGMRWSLLQSFDRIYIIDLHGNSKKKETAPDGSADKNVFNIQQGVSINLFVKSGRKKEGELAQVFHYDLYGTRQQKYQFLLDHTLGHINFQELQPTAPYYLFVPKDYRLQAEYDKGFSVNELFPENSVGIVTARDAFTIHYTAQELKNTIARFRVLDDETARTKFSLDKDVRDWKVSLARKDLEKNVFGNGNDTPVLIGYRPFDIRYTYYTGRSKGFHCMPRGQVMRHFIAGDNVGLMFHKREELQGGFAHIFVSRYISEHGATSSKTTNYQAPLYLYPDKKRIAEIEEQQSREPDFYPDAKKPEAEEPQTRTPNLNQEIVAAIAAALNLRFTPEKEADHNSFAPIDLLDYIYAVLHSPTYRDRYKEFLKIDFPRVPYPTDKKQFRKLAKLGGELRTLHLMEHPKLDTLITGYPAAGSNTITKISYQITNAAKRLGTVTINDSQHFTAVPEAAWTLHIGGYQPAQKWLKDRKTRTLTHHDITHYQRIIVSLTETHRIMGALDGVAIY